MTLAENTILEKRYRIDKFISKHGAKATYRGFDINLRTPVLIKEHMLQIPEEINRFKQEALILTGLRHRALPWVIHHFSHGDHQYLVTDFIEGQNLWEFTQQGHNPLPERQALETMIQICQGVNHLHQQNPPIIHNDIKPENIKFNRSGQAVLVGFGIDKQGSHQQQTDSPPSLSGFIAPERYSGLKVTPLADIYAMGATLYTLVSGLEPPNSLSNMKLKPLKLAAPHLNDLTIKAIEQAMQPKPADRPQSVANWQKELEYILKAREAATLPPPPAWSAAIAPNETLNLHPDMLAPPAKFWLVDPTGMGYPLRLSPLTVGRSPEADVVINDPSVSMSHTYVRTDGQNCLVMDIDSTNGTFLNNHRLEPGWHTFDPGDILIVGPTRFHLTTIQPARLAVSKFKSHSLPLEDIQAFLKEKQAQKDKEYQASVAITTPPKKNYRSLIIALIVLLALLGIGGAAYLFFFDSSPRPPVNNASEGAIQPETPDSSTATITAEVISQLQDGPIEVVSEDTEAITASTNDNTSTLVRTAADSIQAPTISVSPLASSVALAITPVGTVTAIATGTVTLTRPNSTPTPAGPTVIPLQTEEVIDKIGRQEVIDVDINLRNPREVYALVKGDSIYKSVEGGDGPWAKMALDAIGVATFVIDPTNPARFYAPTWNAVLKSTDGGNTWEANSSGLLGNQTVNVVTVDPVEPNILYAGVGENLVVSRDGGQTWTSRGVGQGLGVGRLNSIVVDPFNHNTIYVAGLAGSIYKSVDAGSTFMQLPDNVGQGAYSLIAHPAQRDVLLAGVNSAGAAILKTKNGLDFSSISSGLVFGGADSAYSALTLAPSNPNIIYAGTGDENNLLAKGIFKSTNGGDTWTQISDDLERNRDTRQPYYVKSIAVHPTNPNIVLAATGGGLYKSLDGGLTWDLR